jgi:hypothetical protein
VNRSGEHPVKWYCASLLVGILVEPLLGHHNVAANYDSSKAMTIQGIITRIEMTNPHAWIYMDVKDDNGSITSWRVQLAALGALKLAGFDKTLIDFTKSYSMVVWPAFDGSKHANGRTLTLSDGRTLDVSDKWPQIPVANPR